MKYFLYAVLLLTLLAGFPTVAQTSKDLSEKQAAELEQLFEKGNGQLKEKKYAEALTTYQAALMLLPGDPAILYNAGFAALLNNDNATAASLWKRMKQVEPDDWQVRAKLVQTYQRLNQIAERDKERDELFALRKKGANKELSKQIEYCRDRFDAGGRNVLAFELFEFTGPRGMRYVFSVMNAEGVEDYRITLGSYDTTNAIWRETTEPKPKKGERLFHLDGYFKNGSHATFGMMRGEPSYEATKKMVTEVLEKRKSPLSTTIPAQRSQPDPKKNDY